MKKLIRIFVTIIGLMIMMLVPTQRVTAQTAIGPGTDLIILIDQSNSMFGVTSTGTDRDGRRVNTAQYLIDYMTFDNTYVNSNKVNRVLVISFGSYGREKVIVPLTSLTSESEADKAKALIEPLRSPKESLNGTDFISVLERVAEQFPSVSEDPDIVSGLRQRIIVIITDGGPDLRGTRYNDNDEYFASLGQIYDAELGRKDYPVYVIGIDKNEPPVYWNEVKDLWINNVTGEGYAVRVTDPGEINKQIVKLLCPVFNPTGEGACQLQEIGDHFILPYARSVSFSFFKYDPNALIDLYRPTDLGETGGGEVDKSDNDVLEYKQTPSDEFFGLSFPKAGCWRSERIGAGKVDVLAQIVFNDMVMTQPSSSHPLITPLNFEFSLKDSNGNPIDEQPNFPVHLKATLSGPNGDQEVTMSKIKPGFYASTQGGALTTSEGLYTLSLTGDTTIPALDNCLDSAQTFSIFSQTFKIPVYVPTIELTAPNSPYYHYKPLQGLAVQFLDKNGFPLNQAMDSRYQAEMILTSPSGESQQLRNVQPDGSGFRSDDPVFLPEPGSYDLTLALRDSGSNEVIFEDTVSFEVAHTIEILHPGPNHPLSAPTKLLEIELQELPGDSLPHNPDYPLDIAVTLLQPDGSVLEELTLHASAESGRYVAPIDWNLTQSGLHTLEIIGSTSIAPGKPTEPTFIALETFNVSENLPFFTDSEPNKKTYPLHYWYFPPLAIDFMFNPQPIAVELRYADGCGEAQEFFIDDMNSLFSMTLVGPDQATIVDSKFLLSEDGTNFSVELPGLRKPGIYTATISLNGNIRGGIATEGAWPDIIITFERQDPLIYKIIWIVLVMLIAGLIIYFGGNFLLNRFFLSKAKGTLIAETAGMNPIYLQEFPITPRLLHHFKIKGHEIDPVLGLSRIDIRWVRPQEKRGGEEKSQIFVKAYNGDGLLVANQQVRVGSRVRVSTQRTVPTDESEKSKAYHFRYEE